MLRQEIEERAKRLIRNISRKPVLSCAALERDATRLISAATLLETSIVIEARFGEVSGRELDLLMHKAQIADWTTKSTRDHEAKKKIKKPSPNSVSRVCADIMISDSSAAEHPATTQLVQQSLDVARLNPRDAHSCALGHQRV